MQPATGRNDRVTAANKPVIRVAARCLSRIGARIAAWVSSRVIRIISFCDAVSVCGRGSLSFGFSFGLPGSAPIGETRRRTPIDLRNFERLSVAEIEIVGAGQAVDVLLREIVRIAGRVASGNKSKSVFFIGDFQCAKPGRLGE